MKYTAIKKIISFCICVCIIASIAGISTAYAGGSGDGNGILAYGIDVSSWQGSINWEKVKKDGKSFAVLRIGTSEGKDSCFEKNYKNAKAAGLELGCYFYTYSSTVAEAEKDAELVISWLDGKQLEYPVYYDMENSVQLASGMTTSLRTKMCLAFMKKLSENGWYTGTYANENWYSNYLDKNTLGENNELWLASWMDSGKPTRDYSSRYGLWQYTSSGKVSGIETAVDLDVAYKDYPTIMKNGGFNGYTAKFESVEEEWVITSSNGVNVRSGAGTSFDKVGFLPFNKRIHITAKMTGNNYTWGRFELNGSYAWCVLDYAKKVTSKLSSANKSIKIKENFILGIEPNTDITADLFKVDGLAEIKITPADRGYGTGTEVKLVLGDSTVTTYYVVISGDINGDGVIDSFDLTRSLLISNMQSSFEEDSPQFAASDLNGDGVCDILDSQLLDVKVNAEN